MEYYGFRLMVDKEQAEVIQYIYSKYALDSWGFKRISEQLNNESISSPTGQLWTPSTVKMILSRKGYRERIIDTATDDKVKMLLKGRADGTMALSSHDYPFSAILQCGKCGAGYKGGMDGKRYRSYRCSNRCGNKMISETKLEKLFIKELASQDIHLEKKWFGLSRSEKKELVQYSFEKIVILKGTIIEMVVR